MFERNSSTYSCKIARRIPPKSFPDQTNVVGGLGANQWFRFENCLEGEPNELIEVRHVAVPGLLRFVYIWFDNEYAWVTPSHNMNHHESEVFSISNPQFFEKVLKKCDSLLELDFD